MLYYNDSLRAKEIICLISATEVPGPHEFRDVVSGVGGGGGGGSCGFGSDGGGGQLV